MSATKILESANEGANRNPAKPWWRADIQGLRAVAILGVVAFHAGVPLRGGFTGVDVFFVISGFVIGGLLFRELQATNRVSASRFYLRRARRLLPAAAVMLIVCVILSAVLITPLGDAQKSAGMAASAASVFLSNAYFFVFTGGYFQPNAESNPFLHTWSLSVEEQFYLVLPWVLVIGWFLARKSRLKVVAVIVAVALVASFAASVLLTFGLVPKGIPVIGPGFAEYPELSTQFAFFSPVTRAWEFLAGTLALLVGMRWRPGPRVAAALASTGLILIAVGYVVISEDAYFPGFWVLLPVLGTTFVLHAGSTSKPPAVTRGLSKPPMNAIGSISYSWYLWHWPLIVFAVMWFSSAWITILVAIASIIPAVASYRLLETPIHARRWFPKRRAMAGVAAACVALPLLFGLLFVQMWKDSWYVGDIARIQGSISSLHQDKIRGCNHAQSVGAAAGACLFSTPGAQKTVLLIGDSNAGQFTEPAAKAARSLGVNLEVATPGACPLQIGVDFGEPACSAFVKNAVQDIDRAQPPYAAVVVANSGKYPLSNAASFAPLSADANASVESRGIDGYSLAVANAVKAIAATSPVILIEPIPQGEGQSFPRCLLPSVLTQVSYRCASLDAAFVAERRTKPVAALRAAVGDNATLYDPTALLCQPDGSCSMYRDGELVYRDESHLSVSGSDLYVEDLKRLISQAVGGTRDSAK